MNAPPYRRTEGGIRMGAKGRMYPVCTGDIAQLKKIWQARVMIDRKQVEYIAGLARLSLTDAEIDSFTRQLGSILEYMEQLDRIDTSKVEPTCFVVPGHDPLRDDCVKRSLAPEHALQNAPSVKRGFFAIPKVIG